jgi:hypothetical protein
LVTLTGAADANVAPPPVGAAQAASVELEAVRTSPLLGAVAAETETTVVAVRNPDAVRSLVKRESSPCAMVPVVAPKAASA